MKLTSILIAVFLFTFQSNYCQCSSFIKSEHDAFDKSTLNTSEILLSNNSSYKLRIDLSYTKNPTNMYSNYVRFGAYLTNQGDDLHYMDKSSTVQFLFVDESREILYGGDHVGHIFKSLIWDKPFDNESTKRQNIFSRLKNEKVKAIRFFRGYEKVDYYLNSSEQNQIMQMFGCIRE